MGTRVSLNPFTGSVTLPEGFVTSAPGAGLTSIQGGGETNLLVDPAGDELFASFEFGPTGSCLRRARSPWTSTGRRTASGRRTRAPRPSVLFDFGLFVDTGDPQGPGAGMFCESADGQDVAIDALEVDGGTPAPTTTVTTTATAAPVRPVVVQTDFAAEEDSTVFPLGLGAGILALSAGAAALTGTARRSASRRH